MDRLHMIDTLGVFVEPSEQSVINWSKVDFANLERGSRLPLTTRRRIEARFEEYLTRISSLGYNSLSFDDVAHLVCFDWYDPELRLLLGDYRKLYTRLFAIASAHNMRIYVNSDYLFTNGDIRAHLEANSLSTESFFEQVLEQMMITYPKINGVILRIGENDGKDVAGQFLSKLFIRTPHAVNKLLRRILPLFERENKQLIFRTWTVGVYSVGDMIWNKQTYDTALNDIQSNALIVSMKFGDTDFMRYLDLNPLLTNTRHKKIIELQTRREWEGMGTYPSFVGWDYEKYLRQLTGNNSIVGMHVWCQTGGWAKKEWTNVTYLDGSSFWNELNTYVTARLYIHGDTVDRALSSFCKNYEIDDVALFTKLLRLSEIAVTNGIYISELAAKQYYFRRSRVPTLFWITWDTPLFQSIAVYLVRAIVRDHSRAIKEARAAANASSEMSTIAETLQLPDDARRSLETHAATLNLFVHLKSYILGDSKPSDIEKLRMMRLEYTATHPLGYTIPPIKKIRTSSYYRRYVARYPLAVLFRTSAEYRRRDKVFLASSPVQRGLIRAYMKLSRSKLADQSMGIDSLFQ